MFKAFTWNTISNAKNYYLYVGTVPGAKDVFDSGQVSPSQTGISVWGMLPNTTYYARLWVELNDDWLYTDTTFSTSASDPLPNRTYFYSTVQSMTAQVRGMTIGESDQPSPGTPLATEVKNRGLDQIANCMDFSNVLLSFFINNRIIARKRETTLDGTYFESHTMVEYYDPFVAKWSVADANFGLLFFDDSTQQGQSVEEVSQYVIRKNFSDIKIKFVTPHGGNYLRLYYMDVLSLYLNPIAPGGSYSPNVANDPHPFLTPHTLQEVIGAPGFYVFEFANQGDTLQIFDPEQGSVIRNPIDSTLWSGASFFYQGWQYISAPQNLKVYTFPLFWTNVASLVSPANQEAQVDPSQAVMFSWTAIPGMDAYYLYVGTAVGAKDVYDSGEIGGTLSVNLTPNSKYFVRLWTKFHGDWFFRDTTLQTGDTRAQLISPFNGATNVDSAKPAQFSWTTLPDALSYTLIVGTAFGGQDVYRSDGITQSNLTLSLQSNTQYYAELWTEKSSGSFKRDITFHTGMVPSVLTSPANNANNINPAQPVQFSWTSVPKVQAYCVYVGTNVGAKDAYDSGEIQTTSLAISLKQNTQYFVRMWTKANGVWYYTDSSFQTGIMVAQLISPPDGATTTSSAVPLSWTNVTYAQTYYLYVGTSPGAKDVYDSSEIQVTSLTVNLNPNTKYYVRLWTRTAGVWHFVDSTFQSGSQ